MRRNRFYSTVVPLAGLIYVIFLVSFDGSQFVATIGVLLLGLFVLAGTLLLPADTEGGRQRDRNRARKR